MDRGLKVKIAIEKDYKLLVSILILMDRGLKEEKYGFLLREDLAFQSLFLWTEDLKFLTCSSNIFLSTCFNPYSYGQRT